MNTKQHVLLRAAQLVLCCAAALAALLLSLEATLFKEGYLIKKLDEADYFDTLTNTVRAACGTEYIELVRDLCDMMMTPSNCAAYVRQLRDCAIRYRLDALLHETRSHIA